MERGRMDAGVIRRSPRRASAARRVSSRVAVLLLSLVLVLGMCPLGASANSGSASAQADITVYIDVEGYNLGQGFYVEPTKLTIPAGTRASVATVDFLASKGIACQATGSGSSWYLSGIYGIDKGYTNPPPYITISLGTNGNSLLSEFDYSDASGWMITVNHVLLNVGAGSFTLKDGDVVRWQFTVQGYGADIGINSGWGGGALYTHQDKTALVRALFAPGAVAAARQQALDVLIAPLATAGQVADAIAALEGNTAVKSALRAEIAASELLSEAVYTSASWTPFAAALAAAKTVDQDAQATQGQVDAALSALTAAKAALELKPPVVDKMALHAAIVASEQLEEAEYIASTWVSFAAALASAKVVDQDGSATQGQVDAALSALNAAKDSLAKKADKTALRAAIASAELRAEADYTPASWILFASVLGSAKTVVQDASATQAQANAATSSLNAATAALVQKPNVVDT
ncbi:MAG: DUF4430 domain-containing protein, partial [Clostridiales Family XIII bacterium]|nr:DUF4430 domain-containing protein [Clostridiales Family XIII bacterium]